MASVFSHVDAFQGSAGFYAWVDRIAVNAIRDHFRRRRWTVFFPYDDGSPDVPPSPDRSPESQASHHQLIRRLARHMKELRPSLRLPVVLSLVHGYTAPEIAEMLDINNEAAKKRISRGKAQLLKRVREDSSCAEALRERTR